MKIVYFSLPGHGHVNPTLILMQELQKRNHEIAYYANEEFRGKIIASGIPFYSYNPKSTFQIASSKHIGLFVMHLVELTKSEIPYLLPKLQKEKPDMIIHDSYALWGKFLAQKLNIPAISIFTTMMFPLQIATRYPTAVIPMFLDLIKTGPVTVKAITEYKKLARAYKVNPDKINEFFFSKEKLNIVFTSDYFQPFSHTFDKSFDFVGPILSSKIQRLDFLDKRHAYKKRIYISMGTNFNKNLALFHNLIDTFTNTPYQVIVSLGNGLDISDIGTVPDNVIVKKYLPQISVLNNVDIFISHAGMNSVHESLYQGVPMILFPQTFEQKVNALRVDELGAGICIKKNQLTKNALLQAVQTILTDKRYLENINKIKNSLISAGGLKKASEIIEEYHKKH